MKSLEECGRSTIDKINYLLASLTEQEKIKYFRLKSFVNLWTSSTGGTADMNEHTGFFSYVNTYSLRQIDAVFFEKFRTHIGHQAQLEMTDAEWEQGITPSSIRV